MFLFAQAERMSGRVKHRHKKIPAELRLSLDGAQRFGFSDRRCDVVDLEIKVHLLLLPAVFLGPDGRDIVCFFYKQENGPRRAADAGPVIKRAPFPAQQLRLEALQAFFVLAVDHNVPQKDLVFHPHHLSIKNGICHHTV